MTRFFRGVIARHDPRPPGAIYRNLPLGNGILPPFGSKPFRFRFNGMQNHAKTPKGAKPRGRPSTLEILGVPARNGKVPAKWAEHHRTLTGLRDRFLDNKNSRTETARVELPSSGEHMADAATDSYDRDWALAMVSSDQSALYEIEQALDRIANGTYGCCELTGRPIEKERLRAIPWARFSAAAQAELESRGAACRTHLGELGTWTRSGDAEKPDEDDLEEAEPERKAA